MGEADEVEEEGEAGVEASEAGEGEVDEGASRDGFGTCLKS